MDSKQELIPYDQMKLQLERAVADFLDSPLAVSNAPLPKIVFEKGVTTVSFPVPSVSHERINSYLTVIVRHIENLRLYSFEEGHYALQALNSNIYNTDNMADNIKFEIFSLVTNRFEINKKGNLSQEEINAAIEVYRLTYTGRGEDPRVRLAKLGARILENDSAYTWDYIAGYEDVKRSIRETILMPLKNPGVYEAVAKMTRRSFESNRPRAVLFEGEPGVGKTTIARIIASDVDVPLVYVPIESIMSKWYGQSSQNLSAIFDASEEMGGAIIFIDEIDSLATSREGNMFEATRRLLSVLLRKLDGIDAAAKTITIGATNRTEDLDHALISRFDQKIFFPLPDASERAAIFKNYAIHLSPEEITELGERSKNFSGRNIKDICESAERKWARRIIVKNMEPCPPPQEYYLHTITQWKRKAKIKTS